METLSLGGDPLAAFLLASSSLFPTQRTKPSSGIRFQMESSGFNLLSKETSGNAPKHRDRDCTFGRQFFRRGVDGLSPYCDWEISTFVDYIIVQKIPKFSHKRHKTSQNCRFLAIFGLKWPVWDKNESTP
jgi:hypothetical protein